MNELSWRPIRPLKVRSEKMIASFDSKANDPSVQFINKMNYLRD